MNAQFANTVHRHQRKLRLFAERCQYQRQQRLAAAVALCTICMLAIPWFAMSPPSSHSLPMSDLICAQSAAASTEPAGCTQLWTWPIASARVLAVFDPPAQNWLPGHRGIDLAANTGTALIAPSHGTIAFAGSVGGKSVVSIRHGTLTSTFEPAITDRAVGDTVSRGEMFATVSGESDHCADECVHWGLKRPDANIHSRYIDPAYRVQQSRVALKPVPTV